MRLFTGIAIPPDVISKIDETLAPVRPLADVKWSPPANLHITTKFIGSWPEERLAELERALGAIKAPRAFDIRIAGFSFFPNPGHPRILVTNVEGGESLQTLARVTEDAVAKLGCAREERPYSPHLTLARFGDADTRALRSRLQSMPAPDFGSWRAGRFHLYLSQPGERHSIYTALASWPLAEETAAA
jgi:2'-5' RNA ligase